ncbi:MAG: L-fuculose-phosphate aldolase [Pseudomonadota bacterium]|nr:L-fuculose-phosphate aldolase [Pseudomonadota bacterium]
MNIKDDLIRHYHWLRKYGYNDSHSGNASVRDGSTLWVTPTGCCADILTSENLIACSLHQPPAAGASIDAPLHLAVMKKSPAVNAVLHSHGAYSVAMTMHGEDFFPADFEGQLYFRKIPVITIPYERYTLDATELVSDMLQHYPVTVVRGHGVYAAAESINLAYKWTCSFELSAKTCFLAKQAGTLKSK